MEEHHEAPPEEEPWYRGPLKFIIGLFLLLLIILMVVPYYGVKLDPHPKNIPSIGEVLPEITLPNTTVEINSYQDYLKLLNPQDPIIRQIATTVATTSCEGGKVCHAKALYYFVRDNIKYVSDPVDREYIEDPKEVLVTRGSDCESGTILLANLLEAIGVRTEFVFITGHAYLRAYLPEALNRYKRDGDWVYMDWTCSNCDFGETPWSSAGKIERVV